MANADSTGGVNVAKEVATMRRMTVGELREKYADVFGEGTQARNKQWLIKRIAWRIQANEEGDLSERALRRANELANDADLRLTAPRERKPSSDPLQDAKASDCAPANARLPLPGSTITRPYKGRNIEVKVLHDGFEYDGDKYKSLSAVAKAVTGTHWNGYHFFNLKKKGA
jgi:hypothetical protein